ncbi:MAG: hypothetical protein AAGE52_36845 [Myxococcota bacterium]
MRIRLARGLLWAIAHPKRVGAVAIGLIAALVLRSNEPETAGYGAMEVVADESAVYWSDVRVHEYDDEPAFITRATLQRMTHDGERSDLVFDFKRDGHRCTPRALSPFRGSVGWLCYQEWVDGPFDPSMYMHVLGRDRYAVPFRDGERRTIATGDRFVYSALRDRRVVRLDPVSGERTEVSRLPDAFGRTVRVVGATEQHLWGLSQANNQDIVWKASLAGAAPERVMRVPSGTIHDAAAGQREVVLARQAGGAASLVALTPQGQRVLLERDWRIANLTVHEGIVYFASRGWLERANLASGASERIARARITGAPAIGGGFVYWVEHGTVRRVQLP